ncbi:replication protein A 32 kDa subunit A-like [Juglans microcarpa x Juglans regia]|uniref:replication protein A 32 kDa subunit A-like n=1 Tax=Juglans microcarpa x Juglans regia TaxID=2249226 RepID=UPI001B7F3AC8|nr:replication protein A 32 kDa subunit A-like [Juglans microcarpa x Juglans regia]
MEPTTKKSKESIGNLNNKNPGKIATENMTEAQVKIATFSGQSSNIDGVKSCDQLVLDYLQQPASIAQEKGVHRDELSRQLKIPVEKIMESIRSLEEEGLIYSTIDEFHYKSTQCG